jgi:hypothetical protein
MEEIKVTNSYTELYEDRAEEPRLVRMMKSIKDCPVMIYGPKKIPMSYYFCNCDPSSKDAICESCATKCHAGHTLTPRHDYEKTLTKQVCMCGLRCHQLSDGSHQSGVNAYQPICYFSEIAMMSKKYTFYQHKVNGNTLCFFCGVHCLNDDKTWKGNCNYDKKEVGSPQDYPACNCPSQSHKDIKIIMGYINKFLNPEKTSLKGYSTTQLFNIFFKSESSFRNIFSSFFAEYVDFQNKLKNSDFEFDKKINVSNFYWFLGNISEFTKKLNSFYYLDPKIRELISVNFICALLDKKIIDNSNIFTLIQNILKTFQKFTLSSAFENFPKFKFMDITNFSPFQRLLLAAEAKNNQNFMKLFLDNKSSTDFLIIDKYIHLFESLIRMRFDKQEGLVILVYITSMLKKFSKFYLLSYEQIVKFSSLIDDLFYYITNFNKKLEKKKTKKEHGLSQLEIKLVTNISKIFIYFTFYYNDTLFQAYMDKKDQEEANVVFLHSNNELGKLLMKNMVHLIAFLKDHLRKIKPPKKENRASPKTSKNSFFPSKNNLKFADVQNTGNIETDPLIDITNYEMLSIEEKNEIEFRNKIKKILQVTQNLISIFMHTKDSYLLSLKRSLNSNVDFYVKIINNEFLHEEKTFINFLESQSKSIEDKYLSYYNFNTSFDELTSHLSNITSSFFKIIDEKEYKHPAMMEDNQQSGERYYIDTSFRNENIKSNLNNDDENEVINSHHSISSDIVAEKKLNLIPYNLLMSKSVYIFSLIKIFPIGESKGMPGDLIDSILTNLYYFIEKQPDNCLLFLSQPILNSLYSISYKYTEKVLDLIISALKILISHSYSLNHVINIKNFVIKFCYKTLNKENMYSCLFRLLKILKLVYPIKTLYKKETLNSLRKDLIKMCQDYNLINLYKEYLILLSENYNANNRENTGDFNNSEVFKEVFKTENSDVKLTPLLALKTYLKFLSLINGVFDDNALFDHSKTLFKLASSKEIISILKIQNLDLQLRTELIRYFRMVNIDMCIAGKRMKDYRKVFTRDFDKNNQDDAILNMEQTRVFSFLENLVKISGVSIDSPQAIDEYDMLLYELENIKNIFEKSKSINDSRLCINYFENGLLLPLKVYLNKIFSIATNMTGRDYLKIYTLCYNILQMKKFILQTNFFNDYLSRNQSNISQENLKENSAPPSRSKTLKKSKSITVIKTTKLNFEELREVEKDIQKISDPTFKALDNLTLHEVVSKHIMSLIQNPTSIELSNYFSQYESYNQDQVKDLKENLENNGILKSKNAHKIFELITTYTEQKEDFENSCLKFNLSEIHLDKEVSFRTLLLKFLFLLATSAKKILKEEIYFHEATEVILKLLISDTSASQKAVEELRSKEENNVDLVYFAELGFKNLLSIIFSMYNPTTLELSDDYHLSCHIIKIFKFLCEEHNNYFQQIFLRKLDFRVGDIQKIYFYDMMIFTLDKILLLSGWDKIKGMRQPEDIDYFYALFSCVVEMLIEIVQGTQKENLSQILREEAGQGRDYENKSHNNKHNKISNLMKTSKFTKFDPVFDYGKALPVLLNNIKPLLFNDYGAVETIYKVRKELVDLLLAFMEEHSCPKKVKLSIMTNYHPRHILRSIGIALKSFYMKNCHENYRVTEYLTNLSSIKTGLNLKSSENNININNSPHNDSSKKKVGDMLDKTFNELQKGKKDKRIKRLKFSEKLYQYFTDLYFTDQDFSNSPEFQFCSSFYNYFKITVLQDEYEEAVNFWQKINNLSVEEIHEFNKRSKSNEIQPSDGKDKPMIDDTDYEIFYVVKFFEQISKSVQIQLENVKEPVLVVYTMSPLLRFLSTNSKENFIRSVNRDNRYSKLYALMEETNYFKLEIEHNWTSARNNRIVLKTMQLDYYKVGMTIYLLVVLINLILLSVLRDSGRSSLGSDDIKDVVQNISFVFIALDVFFVILWCITKLPLNYKIAKEKYLERMKIEGKEIEQLSFFDKLWILIDKAIIEKGEINNFIWLFIFVLAAAISDELVFLYSIALMSAVNLSTTLSNIVLSIILKKGQLAWTAIFTIICLYVYSAWGFFYIPDRFIDWKHREEVINIFRKIFRTFLF